MDIKNYLNSRVLLRPNKPAYSIFEALIIEVSDSGKYFKFKNIQSENIYWESIDAYTLVDTIASSILDK